MTGRPWWGSAGRWCPSRRRRGWRCRGPAPPRRRRRTPRPPRRPGFAHSSGRRPASACPPRPPAPSAHRHRTPRSLLPPSALSNGALLRILNGATLRLLVPDRQIRRTHARRILRHWPRTRAESHGAPRHRRLTTPDIGGRGPTYSRIRQRWLPPGAPLPISLLAACPDLQKQDQKRSCAEHHPQDTQEVSRNPLSCGDNRTSLNTRVLEPASVPTRPSR